MKVTIYHNPRCSKSRLTLQLLEDNNIQPEIVRYLEDPPAVEVIDSLLTLLQLEPRELMRRNEAAYAENQLDNPALSRAELIEAMSRHPKLIERPVVVVDGRRAAIGRPPEQVLSILD